MKKIYKSPSQKVVEFDAKDSIMLLSGSNGEGDSILGDGGEGDGIDIGVKELSSKNLWDTEW